MGKKFGVIALIIMAFGFGLAARSNAGTEMIIDNSAQTMPPPRPVYRYAPPPPPRLVYYVPRPRVVIYPRPVIRAYGYHRPYLRHSHWRPGCR